MHRQILMASVGALALTGSAVAADLPLQPAYPPAPLFTWTGLYVGGQIGYGWGSDHASITNPVFYIPYTATPGGVIGGAHLGYNLQLGPWVAGIEGDVNGTSISQSKTGFFLGDTFTERTNLQGSIRARAGYAFDRVLFFATGGAAFGGFNNTYATPFGYDSVSRTRSGWTVGGGLEYAITNNWSVQAEYRYSDFGHYNDYPVNSFPIPVGATFVQHHFTQNQVQVGFSYKFDSFPLAPAVARY
jgi:outer membrane immunogenic protein